MAEMIFGCPHCGEAVQCDSQYAGQTVACPHCQGGIIVPEETPAPVDEPAPETVVSEQEAATEPEPGPEPEASDQQPSPQLEPEDGGKTEEPESVEPEPEPQPTPEPEPAPEPAPEPVLEPEASEPVDGGQKAETSEASEPSEPSSPEPASDTGAPEPVAPKPKQPRLPQPGAKTQKRRIVRKGGPITTKKTIGASGGLSKPMPKPQPKPETAAEPKQPEEAAAEASGEIPKKAKGWSWAAFLWGPIWAIGNKVWWGLLTLVPVVNLVMIFVLAAKGKKQAWAKAEAAGKTIEQFVKVQKRWVIIWLILFVLQITASVGAVVIGGGAIFLKLRSMVDSGAITIEATTSGGVEDSSGGMDFSVEESDDSSGEVEVIDDSSEEIPAPVIDATSSDDGMPSDETPIEDSSGEETPIEGVPSLDLGGGE